MRYKKLKKMRREQHCLKNVIYIYIYIYMYV